MNSEEKKIRLMEAAAALLDAAEGRRLNAVALNKALFYLDLVALRDLGETFTGNTFVALEKGPVVAKYQERLIGGLKKMGIADQVEEGMSKPVTLRELPTFTRITPEVRRIAEEVGGWCSGESSTSLSDLSHRNPGWRLAREDGERENQVKPINMLIALQQMGDADPWMKEPLDAATRAACEAADTGEGDEW